MRRILLFGLMAAAAACSGGRNERSPERIILITIDTLRADHLGCYGAAGAQTPSLDALARESILYEDVTSPAPITLVSHATILTGLTPPAHGVRTNGSFRLPPDVVTLAERLKARGFATGAFVGSFVLHHEFGLDQGFDTYDDALPRAPNSRRFDFSERRASQVLSRAADWVALQKSDRFFLWIHLFDPHAPYDPPAPFDVRFPGRAYDGEIAYVDSELGSFFQRLRDTGLWDQSLLLVMADHGEGLGQHGEKTHGLFLYQSTLRVPLIVRPPGGASPSRRVHEPVGLVDVTPTILAAVGAPPDRLLEGHPLSGFPTDGGSEETAPASTPAEGGGAYYSENMMPHFSFGWAGLRGYRDGSKKIIRAIHTEIYDLASDPGETQNLAARGSAAAGATDASRIEAELTARLNAASRAADSRAHEGADNPDLSEQARQSLLALGYVAAGGDPGTPLESGPDPREMLPFFEGIEQAKDELRAGRTEEAIATLEKLSAQGPGSVGVLGLLGQAHMERGELDAAMKALIRARAIDPRDYEIRRRIAEADYAKGDYDAAVTEAREALRLNDRNAESRSVLGAALARLGRHEEAIASFREAIAQRPEEAALQYNLGLALERASRPAEAESAYKQAVELDPGASTAQARVAIATLMLKRKEPASALQQLEAAVRLDPGSTAALEQLGIVRAGMGDFPGALEAFDHLLVLEPGRAEAHFDRGLVLEKLGRRTEAIKAFHAFISRWKGDPSRVRSAQEHLARMGG